ncbi:MULTISPECIES: SurA N-terminal domain-containing protein [Pseudomonas]|uniref:peptidylprolyl isomerase n=1 Tax=Pseudomonas mosselii TaxID=78327 RepID=A0A5R8ZIV7_9PSED|nr:SurA N-terminal domain-containing protein [Pseudomonas mosselii]TLP65354.1 peptidylprolyl isomerase [Pseudomonas mosselii]
MRIVMMCLLLLLSPFSRADQAVARVNGVDIGVLRLEHYFSEFLQAHGRAPTSIRNPQLYRRLRDQALDELIDKELLWQHAQRLGIVISEADVEAQVAAFEAALGGSASFDRRLSAAGFDRPGFADYTRHELAAQQAYARLTEVAEPDAAEVQAFWLANRHRFEEKQNQSDNTSVLTHTDIESQRAMARDLLMAHKQAQARYSVRQRLRESATVERID